MRYRQHEGELGGLPFLDLKKQARNLAGKPDQQFLAGASRAPTATLWERGKAE
jgi:hypothetical protein